ncbi:MAG: NAD(P)-dependent oxidoreductase [Candidatus Handelsmanbacteria bacterium]|nr:NAD(P)-dependent oxidoreductase [Candidatus Handelsmanbacteria bacterium]
MFILITGITGRIGANLAATLVGQGHRVRGLVWERDQRVEKLAGLGVELVPGSITQPAEAAAAVDGVEAVYHLGAAFQGGGPFTEEEYFEINVRGAFNMLEAARKQGVAQFLFAGTDALYEKYIPGGMRAPITEEAPRRPRGAYALSKSVGEELVNGYFLGHGLPTTILRFAMVLGAGEILDFPQFFLSKMRDSAPELAALWQGEERLVALKDGQGRYYKKHVAEVRDIVQGCVCALGKEAAYGQTFQLAGPGPFTWDEATGQLSEVLGLPVVAAPLSGIPTYYEFDLSKARRLLGFNPQFDLGRMIEDALRFRQGEDLGLLPTR